MEKLVLNFIGVDDWDRPTYENEEGVLFKDVNCDQGPIRLCTVCGGFDGEPDTPIEYIEKYQDVEIVVTGKENEPTREEKFNYMMLSRLKQDCDYYLGNGNRNPKHLWGDNEEDHINEMKKLHNSFDENKKPEWLTMDDILAYEDKMTIAKEH